MAARGQSSQRRPAPALDDLFAPKPSAPAVRRCDHKGCDCEGLHRAPKDRSLKSYYWFCLDHVQAYNKAWNYFGSMSENEIENEIRRAAVWEMPTWPLGERGPTKLRNPSEVDAHDPFGFVDREMASRGAHAETRRGRRVDGPRAKAMRVLDLSEPLTMEALKSRYKALSKIHHPDLNNGDHDAEERFKTIGEAYRLLVRSLKGD